MIEMFETLVSFPVVVPTALLAVLLILGLFAMLGVLDAHHTGEFDFDAHASAGELLPALGFGRVPIYLIASAVVFSWWVLVMAAQLFLLPLPLLSALPIWLSGSIILLFTFYLAIQIAIRIIRPLKPYFLVPTGGAKPVDFIGRPCKIITGSVDARFGQAEVRIDSGAPHILQVYTVGENDLKRGSGALILSYDEQRKRYEVEPYVPG